MHFSDRELEEKYRRIGFQCEGFGMQLRIGDVDIKAVEHPYKGVALIITCFGPRSVCQFEMAAPATTSAEEIACLIYVNVVRNMKSQAQACREYLERLTLNVFQ